MQDPHNNKTTTQSGFWHVFFDTFEKAGLLLLFFALIYATVYLVFSQSRVQLSGNLFLLPNSQVSGSIQTSLPASSNMNEEPTVPSAGSVTADLTEMPQGNEEIAAFFSSAVNRAKAEAKAVTLVQKKGTNYNGVVEAGNNFFLSSIAKSLMGSFLKEENPNTVFSTRSEIMNNFIPRGTQSALTANDIAEASCTEENGYYVLTVKVKPDENPTAGHGSGAVGSVITTDEIEGAVNGRIKFDNLVCQYDGAWAKIKVEKSTGHLVEISSSLPMYLHLTSLGLNCRIGLQFDELWTVAW